MKKSKKKFVRPKCDGYQISSFELTEGIEGEFEGVVSNTLLDREGERISREALESVSMSEIAIPVCFEHRVDQIVGVVTSLKTRERDEVVELVCIGRIFSKELRDEISTSNPMKLSLGMRWIERDGNEIIKLKVVEISLVHDAANSGTGVNKIKSINGETKMKTKSKSTKNGTGISGEIKAEIKKQVDEGVTSFQKSIDDLGRKINGSANKSLTGGMTRPVAKWKLREGRNSVSIPLHTRDEKSNLIQKAYLTSESVAGSRVDQHRVFFKLPSSNPFENFSIYDVVIDGSSFKIPELSGVEIKNENPIASGTAGGSVSSRSVDVKNYTIRTQFSDAVIQDVAMLRASVIDLSTRLVREQIGTLLLANVKTSGADSTAGTIQQITSGVAKKVPEAANVIGKLKLLRAGVKPQYRENPNDAVFVVSSEVMNSLIDAKSGATGEFALRPLGMDSMGNLTLWSHRVIESDLLDASTKDGDLLAVFGNPMHLFAVGTTSSFVMSEHPDHLPGAQYYYGNVRIGTEIKDADAGYAMVAGA